MVGIGAGALAAYLIVLFNAAGAGRGFGLMFSGSLAWICGFYCVTLAVRNSADCISEEKREGTLGLLFLTDLKGYDVVLGKLLCSGLNSFYGLLAAFPALGMGILLGGVSGRQFWAMILALLNFFFWTHALGLMVSTFSVQQRMAVGNTTGLLVLWMAGFPALHSLLDYYHFPAVARSFALLNPVYPISMVPAFGTRTAYFWTSLWLVHVNAWVFLVISSWHLPRSWQEKAGGRSLAWRERLRQWSYGSAKSRDAFRRRLLNVNCFYWLVSRNRRGPVWVWLVLGVCAVLWIWIYPFPAIKAGNPSADAILPLFVAGTLMSHTLLKFWAASESTRHLEEQRRNGALEFLLSCTPLSTDVILRGQWLALRRHLFWPLVTVMAADCALITAGALHIAEWRRQSPPLSWAIHYSFFVEYAAWTGAAMIMLVADMIAIGWVGMWQAMSQKTPKRAAGATISRILIIPFFLALPFSVASSVSRFFTPIDGLVFVLIVWFVLGIAVDLFFAFYSRWRLRTEFRPRAAITGVVPLGLLGNLGHTLRRLWSAKPPLRFGGNK